MLISNKNNIVALMALAVSMTSMTPGAVNAMGFFDPDAQEMATSAKMTTLEQETPAAPVTAQAIELPDKLNTLVGSLENEQDVKIYSFKVVRVQRVVVHDTNWKLGHRPWLFEVNVNNGWKPIHLKEPVAITDIPPGQAVQLKVSNNPMYAFNKGEPYTIDFGSEPHRLDYTVSGDAPQIPIGYAYTRAYKFINWSVQLNDSTGYPLEGGTVIIEFTPSNGTQVFFHKHKLVTDQSGRATGTIPLGSCYGTQTKKHTEYSGKYLYRWEVSYNSGIWTLYPRAKENAEIESKRGHQLSYSHICDQRMIR